MMEETNNNNKNSELDGIDLTNEASGSQDPITHDEKMDGSAALEDTCPKSAALNITKKEDYALPKSEPNLKATEPRIKPPRLSGAARRRYRLYVTYGASEEMARELCLKPMRDVRQDIYDLNIPRSKKRALLTTQTKPVPKNLYDLRIHRPLMRDMPKKPNSPKRTASGTSGTLDAKSLHITATAVGNTSQKKSQVIRLGVVPSDFPNTMWSDYQLKLIQTAVLEKIVELKNSSIKPQFEGCTFKPGWLVFSCKGASTAQWVRKYVPALTPWSDAVLKVILEEEVPQAEFFVGNFPEKYDTSSTRILSLIEGQNDDISVEFWNVLNRVSKGDNTELTLEVDLQSAYKLKQKDYCLGYGYGTVHIRPIIFQEPGALNDIPKKIEADASRGLVKSDNKAARHPYMSDDRPSFSKSSGQFFSRKELFQWGITSFGQKPPHNRSDNINARQDSVRHRPRTGYGASTEEEPSQGYKGGWRNA